MPVSKKGLAAISGLFSRTIGKAIPPENLDVWKSVLDPLDDELLWRAALEVVRTRTETFDVAPGAVYQAAVKLSQRVTAPNDGEAWKLVRDVVCRNKNPNELPGAVREAAEQIGWEQLREMTLHDTYTRRDFLVFYRDAVNRNTCAVFEALGRCVGRPSLPEPIEKTVIVPPPVQADGEGEYIPISAAVLREMVEGMGKGA